MNRTAKYILLLLAGLPCLAQAALGGQASALPSEGQPQGPSTTVPGASGIIQQTILTSRGVTITEYSAQGVVFAATWQGPVMPDFSQLLGNYFPQFQSMLRTPVPGSKNAPLVTRHPQVVVHAQGHMRAFTGSTYAPALVPVSFSLTSVGVTP